MRPDFEQPPDVQCHRQERLAACEDQVQRIAALSMKHKPSVAMGIRDKPIAPGSPWRNASAERLIGSILRECVDHMVVVFAENLVRLEYLGIAVVRDWRRPIAKGRPGAMPSDLGTNCRSAPVPFIT